MIDNWIKKGLAFSVILLFIGIAIQPGISTNTIQEVKTVADAKDYLFQTLIDISNNPDVKELLKQNNQMIFTSDYDYKDVFLQLFFKKPRILKSMLFTRPEMSFEYLETAFNRGLEIVDIIRDEESSRIIESISVTNTKEFNELKNIVDNDKELCSRISVLEKMNNYMKFKLDFTDYSIICSFLIILFIFISPIFFLYILLDEMEQLAYLWNLQLIRIILRFFEFLTQIFIFPVLFLLFKFCID